MFSFLQKFLVSVPNFVKEVDEEPKPDFFHKLSEHEQDQYKQSQIQNRMLIWSCTTAAAAYNLVIVLIGGIVALVLFAVTRWPSLVEAVVTAVKSAK